MLWEYKSYVDFWLYNFNFKVANIRLYITSKLHV